MNSALDDPFIRPWSPHEDMTRSTALRGENTVRVPSIPLASARVLDYVPAPTLLASVRCLAARTADAVKWRDIPRTSVLGSARSISGSGTAPIKCLMAMHLPHMLYLLRLDLIYLCIPP